MGSDSDFDEFSDTEIDDKSHKRLLEDVSILGKAQYVQKATRTEPTSKISEYDLVKSATGKSGKINLNELTKGLTARSNHAKIQKKVKNVVQSNKTLIKPLEKPQAQKIRRTIGFKKAKDQLSRWDAIVTKNRISENLKFPLPKHILKPKPDNTQVCGFQLKSDLQIELEKVTPKEEIYEIEDKFPLSMEEIVERRKEMAKLRAHQSYIESKARRQGKIKSKKYHRVQRREKMKQQLKDFEELQKTNPEEALRKLEEIEKARAEERVSLRHKSTGKWAKSKLVRAKYDKETRQVLAQQLSLSKELTQKINIENSSDSEIEPDVSSETKAENANNPWVKNGVKTTQEITDFVSGYRKFWDDKSKPTAEETKHKTNGRQQIVTENEVKSEIDKDISETELIIEDISSEAAAKKSVTKKKTKEPKRNVELIVENGQSPKKTKKVNVLKKKQENNSNTLKNTKKTVKKFKTINGEFTIEEDLSEKQLSLTKSMDLNALFDNLDNKINKNLAQKIAQFKRKINTNVPNPDAPKKKKKTNRKEVKKHKDADLSFPVQAKRPVIDEELVTGNDEEQEKIDGFNRLVNLLKQNPEEKATENIDPDKFITMKPSHLDTELPDMVNIDDENNDEDDDDDAKQREMISEAFEDDDVIAEFNKAKKDEADKDKIALVDLNLPGWGSWGGKGIKKPSRKRKRFIVKFPEKPKRRDDNKGEVIINENAAKKAKEHLVSDLPFPFKTVKDFEASIRAPIGNTFISETAHRKLTRPAVKTKMGAVIEPMDEEELINRKKYKGKVKF